MTTYGKRGKSLLPPFSVFYDSGSNLPSKAENGQLRRQGSTATLSDHHDSGDESRPSRHHDSVEEMASMLLDDTTIAQSSTGPSKGLPQFGPPKSTLSIITKEAPTNEKSTPQSSGLCLTGDRTSLPNLPPVVTTPRSPDNCTADELDSAPASIWKCTASYSRKAPVLSISRMVSKRKSAQPTSSISGPTNFISNQSHAAISANKIARSNSTPEHLLNKNGLQSSPSTDAADINGKIQGMLAATNSLKASKGPVVQAKNRIRDSTVLVRMKSVLNSHLNAANSKIICKSTRNGRLLGSSSRDTPELEDDMSGSPSRPTSLEIRLNEGDNFNKRKVPQITGHGRVKRKPIASDVKPLKSRISFDDLSYGGCSSSSRRGISTVSELSRNFTDLEQYKGSTSSPIRYQVDFNPTFSSSPIAQSTPRIRLQPTTSKDDKETQKNTPDDADRLFDSDNFFTAYQSDMDVDTKHVNKAKSSTADTVKRKGIEPQVYKGRLRSHSRKWKKHPSPSKYELEHLERAFLNHYPNLRQPKRMTSGSGLPRNPPNQFSTKPVLAVKDSNEGMVTSPSLKKAKTGSIQSEKTWLTRMTESMPNKSRKVRRLSLAPRFPNPSNSTRSKRKPARPSSLENTTGGSDMEIDELQLDDPAFDIAMKP